MNSINRNEAIRSTFDGPNPEIQALRSRLDRLLNRLISEAGSINQSEALHLKTEVFGIRLPQIHESCTQLVAETNQKIKAMSLKIDKSAADTT